MAEFSLASKKYVKYPLSPPADVIDRFSTIENLCARILVAVVLVQVMSLNNHAGRVSHATTMQRVRSKNVKHERQEDAQQRHQQTQKQQ